MSGADDYLAEALRDPVYAEVYRQAGLRGPGNGSGPRATTPLRRSPVRGYCSNGDGRAAQSGGLCARCTESVRALNRAEPVVVGCGLPGCSVQFAASLWQRPVADAGRPLYCSADHRAMGARLADLARTSPAWPSSALVSEALLAGGFRLLSIRRNRFRDLEEPEGVRVRRAGDQVQVTAVDEAGGEVALAVRARAALLARGFDVPPDDRERRTFLVFGPPQANDS